LGEKETRRSLSFFWVSIWRHFAAADPSLGGLETSLELKQLFLLVRELFFLVYELLCITGGLARVCVEFCIGFVVYGLLQPLLERWLEAVGRSRVRSVLF